MGKRVGSIRQRTRHMLSQGVRQKGKVTLTRRLAEFVDGEHVKLKLEPSVHGGIFHPRFQGKDGIVQGKKGACYEVLIRDIGKQKKIIVHPVHLKRE